MNFTNYAEARDESERLSRMLKRDVEIKPDNCACDYDKNCGTCFGQGIVYELIYSSCGHVVPDGRDEECEAADCEWREYVAGIEREELAEVL